MLLRPTVVSLFSAVCLLFIILNLSYQVLESVLVRVTICTTKWLRPVSSMLSLIPPWWHTDWLATQTITHIVFHTSSHPTFLYMVDHLLSGFSETVPWLSALPSFAAMQHTSLVTVIDSEDLACGYLSLSCSEVEVLKTSTFIWIPGPQLLPGSHLEILTTACLCALAVHFVSFWHSNYFQIVQGEIPFRFFYAVGVHPYQSRSSLCISII